MISAKFANEEIRKLEKMSIVTGILWDRRQSCPRKVEKHNSHRMQEKAIFSWEWCMHKVLLTSVLYKNEKECPSISMWYWRHTFGLFSYSPTFPSSKKSTCIHKYIHKCVAKVR